MLRKRLIFLFLASFIFSFLSPALSYCRQPDLIKQIMHDLSTETEGGLFDYGGLLKEEGKKELKQLIDQFKADDLNLWIITLPADYRATNAGRIYSGLSLGKQDILIVFNSKAVYGQALALKGESELFNRYLDQSRRYFNQYRASGLAHFATLIRNRIVEKEQSDIRKQNLIFRGFVLVILLVIIVFIFAYYQSRKQRQKFYQERLNIIGELLWQIGQIIDQPGAEHYSDRFITFTKRFEEIQKLQHTADVSTLENFIHELNSFLDQVRSKTS